MKRLTTATGLAIGLVSLLACQPFTSEHSTLARVTVYWRGDGSGDHASSNGARLCESHCAVDPKKIPYGSKVAFPDATCVAVDTGSDVVNRKAAHFRAEFQLSAMPLSLIGFLRPNKRRSHGQKRIHILWWCKFAHPTPRTGTKARSEQTISKSLQTVIETHEHKGDFKEP